MYKKYICIKQHDQKDCGVACLETVSKTYGLKLQLSKIRDISGTDSYGNNVYGLVKAAKTLSGAISTVVAAAVSVFVNVSVGALGNLIFGAFWAFTSLGNLVGYALDLVIDGNINGVIYSW